jgi:Spy/CpxP family protein refolding chaperone
MTTAFRTLFALTGLLVCSLATANPGVSPPANSPVDRYIAQISERLNLTEDQKVRIRPVLSASMVATMSALKDRSDNKPDAGTDPFAEGKTLRNERKLGEEMRGIRSDTRENLADILTPEQMAEYQKMRNESKVRMQERIRARRYE